jgi:addiction module RelB/DinJ family antitoxin
MDATMTHGATVQLRVNAQTKDRSFDVFKRHGLTLTDGIRVYLERVATTNEIPFTLNIPNEETQQVMRDINAGIGLTKYEHKEDMYSHLRTLAKQHA